MKTFWVYIVTNASRTVLYVGMTNNLERRIFEHSTPVTPGFTDTYQCSYLLYYEETPDVEEAIAREKQIKKWSRTKKEALIDSKNPKKEDLSTSLRFGRDDNLRADIEACHVGISAEETE